VFLIPVEQLETGSFFGRPFTSRLNPFVTVDINEMARRSRRPYRRGRLPPKFWFFHA